MILRQRQPATSYAARFFSSNYAIWALLLVISFGWGTSPVGIRVALREGLGPLTVASGSSLVGAVAIVVLTGGLHTGKLLGPIEWRVGGALAILAILLPYHARNLALANASAGFVALVSALIPLCTAAVAHFMLSNERLKAPVLFGLTLGLGGVAVLLLGGDSGIAGGGNPPLAGVLALGSVVSVAFAAVYAKRYAGRYSVLAVTGVQLALGGAGLLLLAVVFEGIPDTLSSIGGMSVAYVGLMGNLVPLALYFLLIRHVTVTYSAITAYIVPFVAVVGGVLVLDEQIQPGIVVGGVLVLLGVVVTDLVRIRDSRREAAS
ncbi:MAG: DMT family transporter [bacterium]|nr:DMT family transporter [bacterium]MDE0287057.1 DMT family transporter [bacterium]MDE0440188.1 DMT family transporter [bacterium]